MFIDGRYYIEIIHLNEKETEVLIDLGCKGRNIVKKKKKKAGVITK